MKSRRPSLFHQLLSAVLAVLLAIPPQALYAGPGDCANPDFNQTTPPCCGCECPNPQVPQAPGDPAMGLQQDGLGGFRPNGGNATRTVSDLQLEAGVGEHRLAWTRQAFSRVSNGAQVFGEGHKWRHSYQWDMVDSGANEVTIYQPDGSFLEFTKSGTTWTGKGYYRSTLSQSGSVYTLQMANGWRYHFASLADGSGGFYYQLQDFQDSGGLTYALTYDANRRLILVSEPGGRWLAVNYTGIIANQAALKTLATVPAVPPANAWTEVAVTDPTAYRYLQYRSPSFGYGNVGEIEFYDDSNVKITGTPYGSTPATAGHGPEKAFDGNTATYYDYTSESFGITGIDLGAGNEKRVSKVRYWPRNSYASRMYYTGNPGRFSGSNEAPVTVPVVAGVSTSDGRSVSYDYQLVPDAVLAYAWVCLQHANYGDGTQAVYGYTQTWPGTRLQLTEVDDPRVAGRASRLRFEYWFNDHVVGNLKAERNPADNTVIAKLDGTGSDSSKVTYADGRVRNYKWPLAAVSRVTEYTDAVGRKSTYTYGSSGQGFLTKFTDPQGRVTTYGRGSRGNLISRTHPDGAVETWTRDSFGLVLTYKDELGRVTTWTRDALHRVTQVTYPDAGFETFTYNAFNQVLDHRFRNGGVEHFAYDGTGRLLTRTDALGNVTTLTYDANDRVASVTDALGHATSILYNERGLVTQATYADASTVSMAYDTYGNRTGVTDELGHQWQTGYDIFNRVSDVADPLGRMTQYTYASPGGTGGCCSAGALNSAPTAITLPSGKVTLRTYNAEWQLATETVGAGSGDDATTAYTYDTVGDRVSTTDPRGKVWTMAYDVRHRPISTQDPLGNVTSWTYDAASNWLTGTWADGTVTTNVYDVMNRLSTTTNPNGETTTLFYGGLVFGDGTKGEQLVKFRDGRGQETRQDFDLRGQRVRKTYADGTHADWTYDAAGRMATQTTVAGQVASFSYDVRNRRTLLDWSDTTPDVATTYDADGRVLTLQNGVSSLAYSYDSANQLLSESQNIAGSAGAKTVSYSYDADGLRSGLTYPDGTVLAYTYTGRNQMAAITAGGPPPLVTYTYDPAGNRTGKALENGTSTGATFDNASRLTGLSHSLTIAGLPSAISYGLALNSVSNITSRTATVAGTAATDAYGYDPNDQLTQVKYDYNAGAGTQTRQVDYAYDPAGNRSSMVEDPDGSGPGAPVTTPYQPVEKP
jgi:YD repeat-containing protein